MVMVALMTDVVVDQLAGRFDVARLEFGAHQLG
jgi:hypothetical protein